VTGQRRVGEGHSAVEIVNDVLSVLVAMGLVDVVVATERWTTVLLEHLLLLVAQPSVLVLECGQPTASLLP